MRSQQNTQTKGGILKNVDEKKMQHIDAGDDHGAGHGSGYIRGIRRRGQRQHRLQHKQNGKQHCCKTGRFIKHRDHTPRKDTYRKPEGQVPEYRRLRIQDHSCCGVGQRQRQHGKERKSDRSGKHAEARDIVCGTSRHTRGSSRRS